MLSLTCHVSLRYGTKWEPVEVQRIPERTNYQGDYGEFGEGYQGMLPDHHLGEPSKWLVFSAAGSRRDFMGVA